MNKNLLAVLIAVVLVGGFFAFNKEASFGSVESAAGAYSATTTTSSYANTAFKVMTGPGMVGHIVVTTAPSAGYIKLWDATSTATSTYQGEGSPGTRNRLIAQTAVALAAGTYVFDAEVKDGLVIETQAGFNGIISTTYKR